MEVLILAASSFALVASLLLWLLRRRDARRAQEQESTTSGGRGSGSKPDAPPEGALDAALYLDLAASMLAAGLPVRALLHHLGQLDGGRYRLFLRGVMLKLDAGASWSQAWGEAVPGPLAGVHSALGLSLETGAPNADFLRILADRQRRHRQRALEKAAARLGVKLVVPLGLCSLPAFICLGVVPVLIAMIPSLL